MIMEFTEKTFTNKQDLFFKIVNKINETRYDIQFDIDGLILNNIYIETLINGNIKHPNIEKYPVNYRLKYFYHNLEEEALKYNTRSEFSKLSPNLYYFARRTGWLDYVCNHMLETRHKWTKEECQILALNYKIKNDFNKAHSGAYKYAYINGFLNEICIHMEENFKYLDVPRIIYCYEFSDNHVYIGLTKNEKQRKQIKKQDINDPVNLHSEKTGLIPIYKTLTDFIPAKEAQLKEQEFIDIYFNNKWIILNRNKAGSLGGYLFKK